MPRNMWFADAGDQWLLNTDLVQHRQKTSDGDIAQCAIAQGRRARVGNIKHGTTEDDLKDYFKNYAV